MKERTHKVVIKHGYVTKTDKDGVTMYAHCKTTKSGKVKITWSYCAPLSVV